MGFSKNKWIYLIISRITWDLSFNRVSIDLGPERGLAPTEQPLASRALQSMEWLQACGDSCTPAEYSLREHSPTLFVLRKSKNSPWVFPVSIFLADPSPFGQLRFVMTSNNSAARRASRTFFGHVVTRVADLFWTRRASRTFWARPRAL